MKSNDPLKSSSGEVGACFLNLYDLELAGYKERNLTPREVARSVIGRHIHMLDEHWVCRQATIRFSEVIHTKERLNEYIEALVENVRRNNKDALLACSQVIRLLSKFQIPLPQSLAELAADFMDGKFSITKSKGRPKQFLRDAIIEETVFVLLDCFHGLKATRSETSPKKTPPDTACSIITEVLEEFGFKLSEKSVEAIFTKRKLVLQKDVPFSGST